MILLFYWNSVLFRRTAGIFATCDQLLPDMLFAPLKCSDEMAMENLLYDERWRYMCNIPLPECTIHPTTLHYFRLRLLFGTIDRKKILALKRQGILLRETPLQMIFDVIKQVAVDLGFLDPTAAQYIDSTYIIGAASVQDTFTLLFQGLRQVLMAHRQSASSETHQELLEALQRTEYLSARKKPDIDWQNAEERAALLAAMVHDSALLLSFCEQIQTPAMREALTQLERLVSQDVEVTAEGKANIRKGVAKNRQCSVVNAEMRHGRKSSSKRFNGYKAHIALEPKSGIITAIVTTEGSTYDGAATAEILEQTAPPVLGGDHAYAGPDTAALALEAGTAMLTPTPALRPYEKDSFTLDDTAQTMTCPHGETAKVGKNGKITFSRKQCQGCPFQAECNPSAKGRKITISPHEIVLRQMRAAARSGNWDDFLRFRCLVEHSIHRFLYWAGRKGRYFGLLKTGLQMLLGGIGHNLDQLGKHCASSMVPTALIPKMHA